MSIIYTYIYYIHIHTLLHYILFNEETNQKSNKRKKTMRKSVTKNEGNELRERETVGEQCRVFGVFHMYAKESRRERICLRASVRKSEREGGNVFERVVS